MYRFEASALIVGGLSTATVLLLHYHGKRDAATAIAVTGALVGALLGVIKLNTRGA